MPNGIKVSRLSYEVLRSAADASNPSFSVVAATAIGLAGAAVGASPIHNIAASTSFGLVSAGMGGGDLEQYAITSLIVGGSAIPQNSSAYVNAITRMGLGVKASPSFPWSVNAGGGLAFGDHASATTGRGPNIWVKSASTSMALADTSPGSARRRRFVSAVTAMALADSDRADAWQHLVVAASTSIGLATAVASIRAALAGAATVVALTSAPVAARDLHLAAETAMGMATPSGSNTFIYDVGLSAVALSGLAAAILANPAGSGLVAFRDLASAAVILPPGGGVPGLFSLGGGADQRLGPAVSGAYPASYAETTSGLILIADGVDPVIRWDALTGTAVNAGVVPPATAPTLGGTGVGTIVGRRTAYVRWIDQYGNPSNLSPISNEVAFGYDRLIDGLVVSAAGVPTVWTPQHGLTTGEQVVFTKVPGLAVLEGVRTVTVTDPDHFTIAGVRPVGPARYAGGGSWTWGMRTVVYGSVPVPADPKIVTRQILRNLAGSADTYYVDIETADVTSTSFTSTSDDETLASGLPVALFFDDDLPSANRYQPPPSHKPVLASHLGRVFAAGDAVMADGHVEVALGSATVTGVGTAWSPALAGRLLSVVGASQAYGIAAVDPVAQTLTLTTTYGDGSDNFATYAIRSAPGERRLLYYTEPQQPEAWPPYNAISFPEDSDDIVGLLVKGSFLFVLERRHIWKFTYQNDPASDGNVFLSTMRGCLNDRCHVTAEDMTYMIDEIGIHRFDGQQSEAISTPIQDLFQQGSPAPYQINWDADQRYWHAAHDPTREVIRWFVALSGQLYPRHAICYQYRLNRWYLEEYPFAVTASTVATIGYRRSVVGSDSRRILCLSEGYTDGVDPSAAARGIVTDSGPTTLVDATAPFAANLAGSPVAIVTGPGAGQARLIHDSTADTLTLDRPWLESPAAGSIYQVGGIPWNWRSGWYRYVEDEADNPRDVETVFQPLRLGPGSLDLTVFYDHSDTPESWAYGRADDGVSTSPGTPEVTIDMATGSGWAQHHLTGHRDARAPGTRHVSVELAGVQAVELMRVFSVTINGARS